jgi:carbonic anhydrase
MSETEKLIKANEEQAKSGPLFPALFPKTLFPTLFPIQESSTGGGLAILTCMDPRVDPHYISGFEGVTSIIRNAGGIVTDDVVRSLVVSNEFFGVKEFLIINHTDCAMLKFTDPELQQRLEKKYGKEAGAMKFYSFSNLEQNIKDQVQKVKSNPIVPKDITVSGLIYDVETRKLSRTST